MEGPKETPTVKLAEKDGNAFAIMGKVSKALKKAGADEEYIEKYFDEATSGDYDHLIGVTMEFVNVI